MTDRDTTKRDQGPTDEELRDAVPTESGGREVRLGIFVILGVISIVVVLFLLTDPATLRGRYMLVTLVEDAGGIRRGDPVQMRGVNIGSVNSFGMLPDGQVSIVLEIDGQWSVPEDSHTRLQSGGLTGGRTMALEPGDSDVMALPWDTIPGADEAGGDIFSTASELGTKASDVLDRLNTVLDEPTVESIRGTTGELQALVSELRAIAEEQRDDLASLTASLNRSAEGFESAAAAGPEVASAVARADSATVILMNTSRKLDGAVSSLDAILTRVEAGEGTLGKLVNDSALYDNLNDALASLRELTEDLRENPGRYIRVSIF